MGPCDAPPLSGRRRYFCVFHDAFSLLQSTGYRTELIGIEDRSGELAREAAYYITSGKLREGANFITRTVDDEYWKNFSEEVKDSMDEDVVDRKFGRSVKDFNTLLDGRTDKM